MESAAGDFQADIAAAPPPPPQPTPPVEEDDEDEEYEEEEEEEEDDDEEETNHEDEILIAKAQGLIDKIAGSPENVKPPCLHALASILETQEARYMEETGHWSLSNGRASYNIGRLGNLLRDNDEFFELISAKFLSETRYPVSVQAATLRLLYSCSLTWVYPHVFEEPVLENIRGWVMDGSTKFFAEDCKGKNGQASDSEMLKTYSTGLLAVCLAGGGQVVEDVITSGLSAKLMRYLRIRVLGEASTSQKESNFLLETSLEASRITEDGSDVKKLSGRVGGDGLNVERDDSDDCFQDCKVGSKDIFEIVKRAVRASEAEARTANASVEAIRAAGDAAAELVKTAALEEFKKKNDEEAAVVSASRAASMVVDAAKATEVSRSCNKEPEPETIEETEEFFIPDYEYLVKLREKFCVECVEILGEYIEVLGPVLDEKGVDVCLALLQRDSDLREASQIAVLLPDVLKLICALAAHRKFAALFVDRGGIQTLLQLPRTPLTFSGLSSCLFAIASLQGIMERVCALPSDVIHQVIALALQLLKCQQDQARKNSALFFAAAFVFRAILDAFDKQEGLKNLLAEVRSGASSATSSAKQIAYHTTVALRQFFRAELLLLVDSIRSNKNLKGASRNVPSSREASKPLDISNEAMDAVIRQIQKDCKLGLAFAGDSWPAVKKFLNCEGHITMLELCQAPPGERYLHDLVQYALGVVHIVTLAPCSREVVVSATLSNGRLGIAVILDAANGAGFVDPEIIQPALSVLVNLVCPPPSIRDKRTANDSSTEAAVGGDRSSSGPAKPAVQAREAVRANNGIKVVLQLLQPRIITPSTSLDCVRALACRVLLGLARDETIALILTKLQVGKKLTELVRDCGSQTVGGEKGRWLTELSQVAIELMAIVTNSGRESTLAATDAATPALRRIERDAIAASTPISYHSSELLLLIHEHLQASGLSTTASQLLKEAQLTPLQSSSLPSSSGIRLNTGERLTLDSIVVNYLKQQHRQCPAPITTLPPLSLLHPHVCPQSKRSLHAPPNITARLTTRKFRNIHGGRRDRQLVYSRFRPWRACRDDTGVLLTCIAFLGGSSLVAAGSHSGELKIFDSNTNNILESSTGHQFPLTMVKSFSSGDTQLLLSSSSHDVRLWDVSLVPKHSFDGIKSATFSHCGTMFSALSSHELSRREILLYDIQTCKSELKFTDPSSSKGCAYSQIHFSPSDIMLLWNGVLWDRRVQKPVHLFDQFTDYGGGGFHPAGNAVIINSEVWDLRKFRLLRSVPSLDQTVPSLDQTTITFNASGDVIYAILRRNLEEVTSAFQTRRVKHPLFSAFRTIDAVNYSDIATCPVDRCVLDFATEPTDSFVGLVTMDDQDGMYSSARVYEIGRRKPTDDDSDPDDAQSDEEEDEDEDEDIHENALLGNHEDSLSDLDDDDDDDDDDGGGIFEGDDEDDDDDDMIVSLSSGDDEDFT